MAGSKAECPPRNPLFATVVRVSVPEVVQHPVQALNRGEHQASEIDPDAVDELRARCLSVMHQYFYPIFARRLAKR
jgi:hypothetical protein